MAMASALVGAERAALNGGVLPADVMYEVLLRVPAKALCRLRLVCRSWRSLTSDPRFAREHLTGHPLFAACQLWSGQIHVVDMSGEIMKKIHSFEGPKYFIMRTQADLICVFEMGCMGNNQAHLINPATGAIDTFSPDVTMGAAASTCILGRIPSTGEYKVLRIGMIFLHDDTVQPCEVVTLGSGDQKWREKSSPPMRVLTGFRFVAVVGGVAYFLSAYDFSDDNANKLDSIAMFDLVTEEWRPAALQGPLVNTNLVDDTRTIYDIQLAKLNGCLVMSFRDSQHCSLSLELCFLISVDRCLWDKRYSIRCAPCWGIQEAPYPLAVLDDGKVVIWLEKTRVLKKYDPRMGTCADLATLEDYSFVGMFEGSLLCSGLQN